MRRWPMPCGWPPFAAPSPAGGSSPRASIPAPIYPYPMEQRLARDRRGARRGAPLAGCGRGDGPAPGGRARRPHLATRRSVDPAVVRARADALGRRRTLGGAGRAATRRRGAAGRPCSRATCTAPWPGIPVFLGISVAAFLAVILVGGWLAGVLEHVPGRATVSPFLATAVPAIIPVPVLVERGPVGAGRRHAGHALRGIPYVLTFYLLLAVLEDSGYLTSAAVLMDRVFGTLRPAGPVRDPAARRGRLQRPGDLRDAGAADPARARARVLPRHAHAVLGAVRRGHRGAGAVCGHPGRVAAFAVVGARDDRGRPRRERDDPGPSAVAGAGARTAARAAARARRAQGLVAVPRLRRDGNADHARRVAGARRRLRDRRVAGHRDRHRAGVRVLARAAGDRGRRPGVRVPAQGARAAAADRVRGRRARARGLARRAR